VLCCSGNVIGTISTYSSLLHIQVNQKKKSGHFLQSWVIQRWQRFAERKACRKARALMIRARAALDGEAGNLALACAPVISPVLAGGNGVFTAPCYSYDDGGVDERHDDRR